MPEDGLKHYYIVKEHPVRIISKCKSHSKGTLGSFLIGFCILYMFVSWVPQILSIFVPVTNADLLMSYSDADPALIKQLPATPLMIFIYSFFFTGVFNLSECLYTLTYIRNRKVDYRALTESLPYYLKTLGVYLLQMLIVAFWTLLFVIPGVIASINFSQAFFILADDPKKGVAEVLAESKMMMYGNKINYVRLLIYYIPYILLAYMPAILLSGVFANLSVGEPLLTLLSFILDLPLFIVMGLISMGRCVFYELMINKGFAEFRYAGQDAFRELEKRN